MTTEETDSFCVVWLYSDVPESFERAARYALANVGYGMPVVLVFTQLGAKLLQIDRWQALLRVPAIKALIRSLDEKDVLLELDIGAARQMGLHDTLAVVPNLRIADEERVAELAAGARVSARY
jgi:hypothetical protein